MNHLIWGAMVEKEVQSNVNVTGSDWVDSNKQRFTQWDLFVCAPVLAYEVCLSVTHWLYWNSPFCLAMQPAEGNNKECLEGLLRKNRPWFPLEMIEQLLLSVLGQETWLRDPSLSQSILILLYIHNTAEATPVLLIKTSLTTDWALQIMLTVLGYVLLGSFISLNSILPNPGLDCSTSPGGQTYPSHAFSSSHAPLHVTLWQTFSERLCLSSLPRHKGHSITDLSMLYRTIAIPALYSPSNYYVCASIRWHKTSAASASVNHLTWMYIKQSTVYRLPSSLASKDLMDQIPSIKNIEQAARSCIELPHPV